MKAVNRVQSTPPDVCIRVQYYNVTVIILYVEPRSICLVEHKETGAHLFYLWLQAAVP